MRNLSKPDFNTIDVLKSCLSTMRSTTDKKIFQENYSVFTYFEKQYEEMIRTNKINFFPKHIIIQDDVITKKKMAYFYNSNMLNKDHEAREYYNNLKNSSATCLYCGYRETSTLDHYLPKAHFPIFSITPINLIPSCWICNIDKSTDGIDTINTKNNYLTIENFPDFRARDISSYNLLHPYFDNVDDDRWLFCNCFFTNDDYETIPAFKFYVKKPHSWNEEKFERMKTHFDFYELNKLFITLASPELSDSLFNFKESISIDPKGDIFYDTISERFESAAHHLINHWKTAFYDSLIDSHEQLVLWLTNLNSLD